MITEWAQEYTPEISIYMPPVPDTAQEQIEAGDAADTEDNTVANTEGTTTGNMSNAAKYNGGWWYGGLMAWQGDWAYLCRPSESFAIYKVRADGSEYQRLGEAYGSSLNVAGDWLYYVNSQDGRPCKMRTDGSMNTKILDEECGFLSVSGDWIYYDSGSLYKVRTDGGEKTPLNDDITIFSCISGDWVYYAVKSEDGGLWRVSADGGAPQQITQGAIQTYCVMDDWVYYIDGDNWNNLWRVHPDGTGAEEFLAYDVRITTFNIADGTLYLSLNVSYEEEGFTAGSEIIAIDLTTSDELWRIEADTEPLCIGPDDMIYFFKYNEGMAWYSMDRDGNISKIG